MERGGSASDSSSLRRREICTSRLRPKGSNSRPCVNWASFPRESGWRGWRTSALSIANSPSVSESASPSFLSVREPRLKLKGPKLTVSLSMDGAPGTARGGRRRNTPRTPPPRPPRFQGVAVLGHDHFESFLRQVATQEVADAGVVVDDHDLVGASGSLGHCHNIL